MPGWTNPPKVGLQTIWFSTSSSGVPRRAQWRTLPAGPIKGRVIDTLGHSVGLAGAQACPPKGGRCFDTIASSQGTFSDTVPYGRYVLSAYPPATRQGLALAASTRTSAVVVSGPSGTAGATLSLQVLQPLPGDVSLNGYDGGVPEISPFAPAPMTVRGCRHGIGVVTIQTSNTQTGKASTMALPLVESPSGSGRYSVNIPPLWPVHGPSTVSYHIYCVGAIVPKAGPATGGNLVAVHGNGFSGATAVMFGVTPSPRFKVLSSSVIEATAPPGTGAVSVTVRTPHGSTPGGVPGAYTYISLRSLAPSSGPASGSTPVLITGNNVGEVDSVWFGGRLASGLACHFR